MKNLKLKLKENYIYILSFIMPIILMGAIYAMLKMYPFGNKTLITSDMYLQYVAFLGRVKDALSGDASILYSFSKSLGGNTTGLFAYYMASPFNLIFILFPKAYIGEAILLITLIKIGLCGLTFSIYLNNTFKRKDLSTLIFSLCYCFMAYNINFQLNIMWLDAVVLLPLVMLGIDKLVNENKYKLYIITLFITIVSNYYIGYMVCIFSTLYFIYKIILKNKTTIKKIMLFGFSSIISGSLAAFILIPTVLSLSSGKAEFKLFESLPQIMIKPVEIVARFFIANHSLRQITGDYPNIYCGVIVTILLILYFMNKKISLKERILSGGFILILLLSVLISTLNLIWHGFDYPVGFGYRFSFLFSFLTIIFAYKSFLNIENISKLKIAIILLLGIGCSLWVSFIEYEGLTKKKIAVTFIFLLINLLLLILVNKLKIKKAIFNIIILFVVAVELFINAYGCLIYPSYAPRQYIYDYIKEMQPIVDKIKDNMDNFYRMEEVFTNTYDDSMLLNYYGITHSSSSNDSNTAEFMTKMGFKTAPTFEGYNRGGIISIDSILGLKYQIAAVRAEKFSCYEYTENNYYKKILEEGNYIVYENPFALPIAFMVNDSLKDVDTSSANAFELNNNILSTMINNEEIINEPLDIKEITSNNLTSTIKENETYYEKIDKDAEASIEFTIEASDNNPIYMFLRSELYENKINNYNQVLVTINDSKEFAQFDGGNYNAEYIGSYEKGQEVKIKVTLNREQFSLKELQVYSCNIDKFKEIYNNLSENIITNTEYKDGYVKGNINVPEDKTLLYTSIPYDEGWKVTVDGNDVEYIKILDGLIGVELREGNHIIEFKYRTPGLLAGIIISSISLIIIGIALIIERKIKYYNKENHNLSQ